MPSIERKAHTGPEASLDNLLIAGALKLGVPLDAETVAAFRTYRDELLRWSARTNLTAFTTPAEIIRQGFLDAFVCVPLLPPNGLRLLDIGSGAGFPAIPIALARPGLDITLVESSRKKLTFLRHIVRQLKLGGVRIVPSRAEALLGDATMLGAFDVVVARAVAPLADIGVLALPFLRGGGVFVAHVGAGQDVTARAKEVGRLRLRIHHAEAYALVRLQA